MKMVAARGGNREDGAAVRFPQHRVPVPPQSPQSTAVPRTPPQSLTPQSTTVESPRVNLLPVTLAFSPLAVEVRLRAVEA